MFKTFVAALPIALALPLAGALPAQADSRTCSGTLRAVSVHGDVIVPRVLTR